MKEKGEVSKENFKIGDRVKFIKSFRKGDKGTLIGINSAWYSIKLDGYGYVISGLFKGEISKINAKVTNKELIKKYKLMEYMNNAVIYIDKLESYKTNLNNALNELRAESYNKAIAEQEGRNKIHEKYHELNDKDIENKARAEGYKQGQKDAAKEIYDFEDEWNLGINEDNLSQKESK